MNNTTVNTFWTMWVITLVAWAGLSWWAIHGIEHKLAAMTENVEMLRQSTIFDGKRIAELEVEVSALEQRHGWLNAKTADLEGKVKGMFEKKPEPAKPHRVVRPAAPKCNPCAPH
jgi:hypothetical protein